MRPELVLNEDQKKERFKALAWKKSLHKTVKEASTDSRSFKEDTGNKNEIEPSNSTPSFTSIYSSSPFSSTYSSLPSTSIYSSLSSPSIYSSPPSSSFLSNSSPLFSEFLMNMTFSNGQGPRFERPSSIYDNPLSRRMAPVQNLPSPTYISCRPNMAAFSSTLSTSTHASDVGRTVCVQASVARPTRPTATVVPLSTEAIDARSPTDAAIDLSRLTSLYQRKSVIVPGPSAQHSPPEAESNPGQRMKDGDDINQDTEGPDYLEEEGIQDSHDQIISHYVHKMFRSEKRYLQGCINSAESFGILRDPGPFDR